MESSDHSSTTHSHHHSVSMTHFTLKIFFQKNAPFLELLYVQLKVVPPTQAVEVRERERGQSAFINLEVGLPP